MKKIRVKEFVLQINGKSIPVKVYREYRANVRASLGKNTAILRMPAAISLVEEEKYQTWFREWLEKQFREGSRISKHYDRRVYMDSDSLSVGERTYFLRIRQEERKTHQGRIFPGRVIELTVAQGFTEAAVQKSLRHLLSRLVSDDYLPEIKRRVHELNQLFFKKEIKNIRLKLNQRVWGSCSSTGNINLSSRLLFAPADVIDYIIIHELAHLVEMNHSDRYWKLVAGAMPDYREKEEWLRKNDHLCQF